MTNVTEGPSHFSDYPEDEAVVPKDLPYAMKLDRWLREHGVKTTFRAIVGGSKIGMIEGSIQLVTRKDLPEDMGQMIVTRCGKDVEFIELSVPIARMVYTAVQKVGNVWVRHIVDYSIGSDDFRQRWDVLVRAK